MNKKQQKAIKELIKSYNIIINDLIEQIPNDMPEGEHNVIMGHIDRLKIVIKDLKHIASISDKTMHDVLSGIIERHKGKVINRRPCCDKPKPKKVTTSRGKSNRIGDYSQHTECSECGKRW